MGKFGLEIEKLAREHLAKIHKSGNKPLIKKLDRMLVELSEHPYSGAGKPEQLKHNLTGFWSRRLNREHRLIYKVDEEIVRVFVISAMGHYE